MNNNSASTEPKVEEFKELVRCCPQGHNLVDLNCPFRGLRELDQETLERVVSKMSAEEIYEFLDYHSVCRMIQEHAPHYDVSPAARSSIEGNPPWSSGL